MRLESLEVMALQQMRVDIESPFMEVTDRQATSAGFFTIIKLHNPLLPLSQNSERTWKFTHPSLCGGGYFVCWPVSDLELCLEAVANSGCWPAGLLVAEYTGRQRLTPGESQVN